MEIALKYKVKQSKNGKFTSNYKASPIDFETQISLRIKALPKISPSKRAFEKYTPRGLFSELYGTLLGIVVYDVIPRALASHSCSGCHMLLCISLAE